MSVRVKVLAAGTPAGRDVLLAVIPRWTEGELVKRALGALGLKPDGGYWVEHVGLRAQVAEASTLRDNDTLRLVPRKAGAGGAVAKAAGAAKAATAPRPRAVKAAPKRKAPAASSRPPPKAAAGVTKRKAAPKATKPAPKAKKPAPKATKAGPKRRAAAPTGACVSVQYDDGDFEAAVPVSRVRKPGGVVCDSAPKEGERVTADYMGKGNWYEGTVVGGSRVTAWAVFEDGDEEMDVPPARVRARGTATVPCSSRFVFKDGDQVEVNYLNQGEWFPAKLRMS